MGKLQSTKPPQSSRVQPEETPFSRSTQLLEEQEGGLAIDRADLDNMLISHSELFYHASHEQAVAVSCRDEAKVQLERVEATVDAEIRSKIPAGEKVTESAIRARIALDNRVRAADQTCQRWTLLAAQWFALSSAFQERGPMLRALARREEVLTLDHGSVRSSVASGVRRSDT